MQFVGIVFEHSVLGFVLPCVADLLENGIIRELCFTPRLQLLRSSRFLFLALFDLQGFKVCSLFSFCFFSGSLSFFLTRNLSVLRDNDLGVNMVPAVHT